MKIANQNEYLQSNAVAIAAGAPVQMPNKRPKRTFQATVSGTGSVSATINVLVSNDGTNFLALGTITLTGTGTASDGFVSDAPWQFVRADVSAISGTSAVVNVVMGI
jgi:hypothetical protein